MAPRHRSRYLRHRAPVRILIYSTAPSGFLYSYFMCYPGMKGAYFLHRGGAGYGWLLGRSKMRRGRRDGGGSFSRFKASKQPAQPETEYFPGGRGCSALSSYPKHVALHKRDQRTPSGNMDARIVTFEEWHKISAVISMRVLKSLPNLKSEPAVIYICKIIFTLICNEHHVIRTS